MPSKGFTDYLSGPSGGVKTPIVTEQSSNSFSQLASSAQNIFGAIQKNEARKQQQLIAAEEFKEKSALNEMAQTAFDVFSTAEGKTAKKLVDQSKRGSSSSLNIDTRLQTEISKLFRKYPNQRFEMYKQFDELGVDHFLFREAKLQQAVHDSNQDAMIKQRESYIEAFTNSGIDGSTMTVEEQAYYGRQLVQEQFKLEQSTALLQQQKEATALNIQVNDYEKQKAETAHADNIISGVSNGIIPLINSLESLVVSSDRSVQTEAGIQDAGADLMSSIRSQKMSALQAAQGLGKGEIERINMFFDGIESNVDDMLNGDQTVAQQLVKQLKMVETSATIDARTAFPEMFTMQEIVGPAAMQGLIMEGIRLDKEASAPLIAGMVDKLNGISSQAAAEFDGTMSKVGEINTTSTMAPYSEGDKAKITPVLMKQKEGSQKDINSSEWTTYGAKVKEDVSSKFVSSTHAILEEADLITFNSENTGQAKVAIDQFANPGFKNALEKTMQVAPPEVKENLLKRSGRVGAKALNNLLNWQELGVSGGTVESTYIFNEETGKFDINPELTPRKREAFSSGGGLVGNVSAQLKGDTSGNISKEAFADVRNTHSYINRALDYVVWTAKETGMTEGRNETTLRKEIALLTPPEQLFIQQEQEEVKEEPKVSPQEQIKSLIKDEALMAAMSPELKDLLNKELGNDE